MKGGYLIMLYLLGKVVKNGVLDGYRVLDLTITTELKELKSCVQKALIKTLTLYEIVNILYTKNRDSYFQFINARVGYKVSEERTYYLKPHGNTVAWIYTDEKTNATDVKIILNPATLDMSKVEIHCMGCSTDAYGTYGEKNPPYVILAEYHLNDSLFGYLVADANAQTIQNIETYRADKLIAKLQAMESRTNKSMLANAFLRENGIVAKSRYSKDSAFGVVNIRTEVKSAKANTQANQAQQIQQAQQARQAQQAQQEQMRIKQQEALRKQAELQAMQAQQAEIARRKAELQAQQAQQAELARRQEEERRQAQLKAQQEAARQAQLKAQQEKQQSMSIKNPAPRPEQPIQTSGQPQVNQVQRPSQNGGAFLKVPIGTKELVQGVLFKSNVAVLELCDSLTTISPDALVACPNFREFRVPKTNNSFIAPGGMLMSRDGATFVRLPNNSDIDINQIPPYIRTIASGAFRGCVNITEITIPPTVTKIEKGAFCGLPNLTTVICHAKIIEPDAFVDCPKLRKMILGYGVSKIKGTLVRNCPNLNYIVLPDSVTEITPARYAAMRINGYDNEVREHKMIEYCPVKVILAPSVPIARSWQSMFFSDVNMGASFKYGTNSHANLVSFGIADIEQYIRAAK